MEKKIWYVGLVVLLAMVSLMARPVMAGTITVNAVTPANYAAGAITDYSISFTPQTSEAANVTIDFSAFGTTGTDMVLTGVSTDISDYDFTGFGVNATGVSANDTAKTITFTGGNVTAATPHTIVNKVAGTGLVITNDQDAETQNVTITTLSDSGTFALTINPGAINAYSVSAIGSPQVVGVSFNVTIQAQDAYSNNITSGADATENITITPGLTDAGATPPSTTTANGTATVSMTMTVAQSGQSITFTGVTSNTTGTSNTFDVNLGAINAYSVSTIGSPQVVGVSFNVTIQAQDAYSNNITSGADATENITITPGLTDAGATPPSTTTANGTATVSMTMTVAQSGQSITFTGVTSNTTGTSNTFDVNPVVTPPSEEEPEYKKEGSEPPPKPVTEAVSEIVDEEGVFIKLFTLKSEDEKVNLFIPKGTTGKTKEGEPLSEITITKVKNPPDSPTGTSFIGLTYNFEPDGATFDPPINLTFTYNPFWIPKEVGPENLTVAYWDEDAGRWVELDAEDITIDPERNIISCDISHFTYFSVIVYTRPADITLSALTISPSTVDIAKSVQISVTLTNTGDLAGSHEVTLKINNVVVSTRKVTLAGHATEKVTFTSIQGAPGSYTVSINGITGAFTVKPAPVGPVVMTQPLWTAPPAPPPAAAPPAPVLPPAPAPAAPLPVNWLIVGIFAAVAVIVVSIIAWVFGFRSQY